ncbi:hypothetical protein AB0M35_27160 [Micromonospora sp. NPDC051196]|uniref:hypothetical protein n=1 Tax=Micromonospora sp. NPDC051196 TaxID=3155281 RepID=UPI0034153DD9
MPGQVRYAGRTPNGTVAAFVEQLDRVRHQPLEATGQERAFDLSYRALPASRRRLFRYLGLHPGPDFDVCAAAALGNLTLVHARRTLADLCERRLVVECGTRYRIPDLIAEHARRLAVDEAAVLRAAALDRLARLGSEHHSDHLSRPGRQAATEQP